WATIPGCELFRTRACRPSQQTPCPLSESTYVLAFTANNRYDVTEAPSTPHEAPPARGPLPECDVQPEEFAPRQHEPRRPRHQDFGIDPTPEVVSVSANRPH